MFILWEGLVHLSAESNTWSKLLLPKDVSRVWGPAGFQPSVCGAFETMLYTDLRKTVTDTGKWKGWVKKDWNQNSEGTNVWFPWTDTERTGWFHLHGVTKSGGVRRQELNNEAWSLSKRADLSLIIKRWIRCYLQLVWQFSALNEEIAKSSTIAANK